MYIHQSGEHLHLYSHWNSLILICKLFALVSSITQRCPTPVHQGRHCAVFPFFLVQYLINQFISLTVQKTHTPGPNQFLIRKEIHDNKKTAGTTTLKDCISTVHFWQKVPLKRDNQPLSEFSSLIRKRSHYGRLEHWSGSCS